MERSRKLLDSHAIPLPKKLASMLVEVFEARKEFRLKGYAVNCAAMVQQIHFYITQEFGSIPNTVKQTLVDMAADAPCDGAALADGRRWIYKSYSSWQETLPWLSDYAFRKVRELLVELGLIEVKQLGLRQSGRDRTCWYTVNYEHPFLQQLISPDPQRDNSTDADGSNSTDASVPSSTTPSVDCQRIPITTSNTTGNTLSLEAQQTEKEGEARPETTKGTFVISQANSNFSRPKPKISDEDKSSEAGGVRMDSDTLAAPVEPWEVAPNQPYPYFLQWRALHYKNQGGHWANSSQSNAYAEFYKNPAKTNILWQEFLQFYNLALDNALALQKAGIAVQLPDCLSGVSQVSDRVVADKAKALSSNSIQLKDVMAPDPNFGARLSALVRQRTLPPTAKKQQPTDSLQMYLSWLHGQEPVLMEEARKKLTRLVMERSDLLADWDERGRLVDVALVAD